MSDAFMGAIEGALNFVPVIGPAASIALKVADAVGVTGWLGQHILGADGTRVANQVVAAAAAATGSATPTAAAIAGLPPDKAAELRGQLAQIAATAQQAQRQAELDTLKADLADVASARAQTISLAQAGSRIAWAPVIISLVVLTTFAAMMGLALTRVLPAGSEAIVNMLLGTIGGMAVNTVAYWVGSSSGSQQKTEMLYRSAPAAAPVAARR